MIRRLGRYLILDQLGRGSTGKVYRAEYLGPCGFRLPVALKLGATVQKGQRLIEREARLLSRLRHPNIVSVLDAGAFGDRSYISMEVVDGWSLKELTTRGPFPSQSICAQIGIQICEALSALHGDGKSGTGAVVHADLKPANVMLSSSGLVKLVDFGSAFSVSEPVYRYSATPAYMAPEQVKFGPVDGRTDLFSLGVLMFELLTRTRMFSEVGVPLMMANRLQVDRYLENTGRLVALRESHPSAARIIARCVAGDLDERYASARQLFGDLWKLKLESKGKPSLATWAQSRREFERQAETAQRSRPLQVLGYQPAA